MSRSRTLHVLSTRAHANAFVRAAHSADGESTALFRTSVCTTNELLSELRTAALPQLRVLGAFEERLLWKRVVHTIAHPAFVALPNQSGIADALGAFAASCHRAHLSGETLLEISATLSSSGRPRAEVLAKHLVAFESVLQRTHSTTKSMLPSVLTRALAAGAPLWPALAEVSQVVVPFLSEPTRASLALFESLAKRLRYEVLVELPFEPNAADWFRSIERNLRFLESTADASALSAMTVSPVRTGPAQSAWGTNREMGCAARLEQYSSPLEQYREVSRQIASLGAQGAALDDIAIVSRSLDRDSNPLRRALAEHGVAVRAGHVSLTTTPLVKWVLGLLHAAKTNYPKETLTSLVVAPYASAYIDAASVNPTRVSRTLASVGARARASQGDAKTSVAPLTEALRRLDTERNSDGSVVARTIERLAEEGQALTHAETAEQFGAALEGLLTRLAESASRGARERFENALNEPTLGPNDWLMTSDTLAIDGMRDAFEKASRAWKTFAAGATGENAHFVDCWIDALDEAGDLPSRALWPGVSILSPRDVAGLEFSHVFIVGATDTDYPKRGATDPLMSQALQQELEQAIEARQSTPPSLLDAAAPSLARAEEEKYWFALALCAASKELVITWPSSDADGKPTVCAPWAEDFLLRTEAAAEHPRDSDAPVTCWERDVREVQSRVDAPRIAELQRRIDVEQHRLYTVGNGQAASDEYCGDLQNAAGNPEDASPRTLSASELETYASCHFRWLAERQFGVSAFESASDESSRLALGKLGHAMLEASLRAVVEAKLVPFSERNMDEILGVGEEAARSEAARWMQTQPQDPIVGELEHQRLWRQVARVLQALCWRREGFYPDWIEETFGEEGTWSATLTRGAEQVAFRGKVDLGLRCGSAFEIVDLKSGSAGGLENKLQPKHVGIDKLQLPIYAAVAADRLKTTGTRETHVDASYLSLRDGTFTKSLREKISEGLSWRKLGIKEDEWLTFGESNSPPTLLEARILDLARGIDALDGRVLPTATACENCSLSGVCRIPAEHPPEEELEG